MGHIACSALENLRIASDTEGPYKLQSLVRAVGVLEMLGESEAPLSLAELCHRMQIHKSTVHRSLMVLERIDLIERTHDNRFRLGLKLYDLGNRAIKQIDLRARVRPYLYRLSSQLGETVHLGMLQKTSVVYLDKAEPSRRVCTGSKTGTSNPVYCTSLGKAMLAHLPQNAADEIIHNIEFVRYTPKTICSPEELCRSLERARHRGFAVDDEEIEMGVRCLGAPIFDENRIPIAAVSISGPTARIRPQNAGVIAEKIVRCCAEISASLLNQSRKRAGGASMLRHAPN